MSHFVECFRSDGLAFNVSRGGQPPVLCSLDPFRIHFVTEKNRVRAASKCYRFRVVLLIIPLFLDKIVARRTNKCMMFNGADGLEIVRLFMAIVE